MVMDTQACSMAALARNRGGGGGGVCVCVCVCVCGWVVCVCVWGGGGYPGASAQNWAYPATTPSNCARALPTCTQ
jgi:hypothetical protein